MHICLHKYIRCTYLDAESIGNLLNTQITRSQQNRILMPDMEHYKSTAESNECVVLNLHQENGQGRLQEEGRHVELCFFKRGFNSDGQNDRPVELYS